MCDECKRGFDRYIEHIIRLFRPIWGLGIQFEYGSEAQCVALFICELFNDALSSLKREKLWERFGGFDKSQGLNVVVLDGGSSTLQRSGPEPGLRRGHRYGQEPEKRRRVLAGGLT